MYQIYADETLIYDSTIEDYKIGKGSVSLETNKSGSFTFSVFPDHFFYDDFVKLKTVITVYKSGKIIFRGRILNDVTDYWNNKVITCEGELGFLQDSIIRPFTFNGTPEELFIKFLDEHNAQVDEFKRFKIGEITVLDPNDYIARSNSGYESALSNMSSRLIEDSLGGYFHITHGEDGRDPVPTIHYLSDFTKIATQVIEFGSNLKNYTKTVKSEEIATAIIPLGAEVDDGDENTENPKLTIASVNNGVDYIYDEDAVAAYGWIFKVVEWDDVTEAANLMTKAKGRLAEIIKQNVTIELTAIDLHLLDHSIESFKVGDYVKVISAPHNFVDTLLCQKQTIDLLKPENDTITLGHTYSTFTETTVKAVKKTEAISGIRNSVEQVKSDVGTLNYKTNQYKIAEQQLASIMSKAFGVFNTEEVLEDGSTIYYMHDKPKLEDSSTLWKMTENTFTVSTDGGATWNAGIDATGKAILNILSVIGIDATWINADNLTAISSNLGGWKIDEDKIYKEWDDPDAEISYRICIRPPNYEQISDVAIRLTEPFITLERKIFGGPFETVMTLSGDSLKFGIFDGNSLLSWLNSTGLYVTNTDNDAVQTCVVQDGLWSGTADGKSYNTYYDRFGMRVFNPSGTRKAHLSYFPNDDATQCSANSIYANNWIEGATVRSRDGLNMTFTMGFDRNPFVMQFKGGVLVDAYYT